MIEDMTIRRFRERTQDFYQRAVANYAPHFPTSPGELNYEHVRQYQLRLAQSGMPMSCDSNGGFKSQPTAVSKSP
jgi:hypothetical protein